jgi:hypothetical protein
MEMNRDMDKEISVYKSGTQDGHDYVDLGLPSGTKWATCNVGASKPWEYGGYYAWGETEPKENYDSSAYKCSSEDDAAHANWGGKWRMPTRAQQEELLKECYWVWTKSYNNSNVKGYIVYKAKNSDDKGKKISKKNETPSSSYSLSDAHIFLPAAVFCFSGDGRYDGSYGYYWSSSLFSDCPDHAWCVKFNSDYVYGHNDCRCYGQSVRAVCPASESPMLA